MFQVYSFIVRSGWTAFCPILYGFENKWQSAGGKLERAGEREFSIIQNYSDQS